MRLERQLVLMEVPNHSTNEVQHYSSTLICRLDKHWNKAVISCNKTQMRLQSVLGSTGHLDSEASVKTALWTGAATEHWGNYMKALNSARRLWLSQEVNRSFFISLGLTLRPTLWPQVIRLRKKDPACNLHWGTWICHCWFIHLVIHSFLQQVLKIYCMKTLC